MRTYHGQDPQDDLYMGSGKLVKLAVKKYGIQAFTKEILSIYSTRDELKAAEAELINESIIKDPMSYNMAFGGHGGYTYYDERNWNHTEESKRKISMANKGRPRPDTAKRNIETEFNKYWDGRVRTPEDRKKKSIKAKENALKGINVFGQKVTCPHCQKDGNKSNMIRWHFDNCRNKNV